MPGHATWCAGHMAPACCSVVPHAEGHPQGERHAQSHRPHRPGWRAPCTIPQRCWRTPCPCPKSAQAGSSPRASHSEHTRPTQAASFRRAPCSTSRHCARPARSNPSGAQHVRLSLGCVQGHRRTKDHRERPTLDIGYRRAFAMHRSSASGDAAQPPIRRVASRFCNPAWRAPPPRCPAECPSACRSSCGAASRVRSGPIPHRSDRLRICRQLGHVGVE